MKITKNIIKQLIKEELDSMQEQTPPNGAVAKGNTEDTLLHKKVDNLHLYLKLVSKKLDRVLQTLGQKAG